MNLFQKAKSVIDICVASAQIIKDPSRLDRVFVVVDKLASANPAMLQSMADDARSTSHGASALRDLPRMSRIDVETLLQHPTGSLGHALGRYFVERQLDPAALPTRPAANEHEYVIAHLYETHDVWHVLTGFSTDVAGELGLQAFSAPQLPSKLPFVLLIAGLLNTLLFQFDDRSRRLEAIARGWAMGTRATKLFGIRWSERMREPLDKVRLEFGIVVEPPAIELGMAEASSRALA